MFGRVGQRHLLSHPVQPVRSRAMDGGGGDSRLTVTPRSFTAERQREGGGRPGGDARATTESGLTTPPAAAASSVRGDRHPAYMSRKSRKFGT